MRRVLKWAGMVLGGLIVLLLVGFAVVFVITDGRINRTYSVEPAAIAVPSDSASIARGRHITVTRGCMDCHGDNLEGKPFINDAALGNLYATNLTSGQGGVASQYTDTDWVKAIRHGVRPNGKPLLFMPSQEFTGISDEDLGYMVAYIKSLPAVDNELPRSEVGPLGRVLYASGELPLVPAELIQHDAPRPKAVEPSETAEYGAYLAQSCMGCHGEGFSGGKIPGTPPEMPIPTNITPDTETGIGDWSEADFFRTLREGIRPDGTVLNEFMPVRLTKQMTDTEIRALYLYLMSVPPRAEGNR